MKRWLLGQHTLYLEGGLPRFLLDARVTTDLSPRFLRGRVRGIQSHQDVRHLLSISLVLHLLTQVLVAVRVRVCRLFEADIISKLLFIHYSHYLLEICQDRETGQVFFVCQIRIVSRIDTIVRLIAKGLTMRPRLHSFNLRSSKLAPDLLISE
jgi:hypothetical protein